MLLSIPSPKKNAPVRANNKLYCRATTLTDYDFAIKCKHTAGLEYPGELAGLVVYNAQIQPDDDVISSAVSVNV